MKIMFILPDGTVFNKKDYIKTQPIKSAENDKLYYFSRSADKPPGKGSNEYVSNSDEYVELSQIKDWRKMLSNFWVAPIEIDGMRYNSVEHYFQGSKISLASKEKGRLFSLDSGSKLSKSSGEEAQRNRKMVVLSSDAMKKWGTMKNDVLSKGMAAKFNQNSQLANVLKLTRNAELWHGAPRVKPERQFELEQVRQTLD